MVKWAILAGPKPSTLPHGWGASISLNSKRRAASACDQKFAFNDSLNERDSIGWKWMSATPSAGSPGSLEV